MTEPTNDNRIVVNGRHFTPLGRSGRGGFTVHNGSFLPDAPAIPGGWAGAPENVRDNAWVGADCQVTGRAVVADHADLHGHVTVLGCARVDGYAMLDGVIEVSGNAHIGGDAKIVGRAAIGGDADITETRHFLAVDPIASEDCAGHMWRTKGGGHYIRIGCWWGTVDELRDMVAGENWPAADYAARELHRPELLAFVALCEARIATWGN